MNPLLHPEKRPDSNGNLVTRWVRSLRAPARHQVLPAPATPQSSVPELDRAQKLAAAKHQLMSSGNLDTRFDDPPINNMEENLAYLLDHDPQLFERVMESAKPPTAEMFCWQQWFKYNETGDGKNHDEVLLDYRRALAAYSFVQELSEFDADYQVQPRLRQNLLTAFDADVAKTIMISSAPGETPSDEQLEATSIFVYLSNDGSSHDARDEYDSPPNSAPDIRDDIALITSNLQEVRVLLPELKQRGTYDREVIRMLLESPSVSLREGEL